MSGSVTRVQIVGLFNSGTNLMAKIIKRACDNVIIHPEGHTIWWKHAYLTDDFFKKVLDSEMYRDRVFFVIVVKRLDWWKNSMKKRNYSLKFDDNESNVELHPPNKAGRHVVPNGEVSFKDLDNCWEQYYRYALRVLPSTRTIIVKYHDILHRPKDVAEKISRKLRLRRSVRETSNIIRKLLSTPAKLTGNSTFGQEAKKKYPKNSNFDFKCIDDKDFLIRLGYD